MPYRCMTRANLADRADIELLKATGCKEICIGLESADPFIHEIVVEKERYDDLIRFENNQDKYLENMAYQTKKEVKVNTKINYFVLGLFVGYASTVLIVVI